MDREKVLSLAKLARIKISDTEAETLSKEFESILNYVSEVKSISANEHSNNLENVRVLNVMREDGSPHETGIYTETILNEAPARDGDYLKVKKIL